MRQEMIDRVDYICAFYFGIRRTFTSRGGKELYHKNKFTFLDKQIEYLEKHREEWNNVIFSVNLDDSVVEKELEEYIEDKISQVRGITVLYRPNINLSYGGWEDSINFLFENGTDSPYAFLNEDDYIPCVPNFKDHWLKLINDETVYVCGLWSNHASISFGLINYDIVKKVGEGKCKFALPGRMVHENEQGIYGDGIKAQLEFLDVYKGHAKFKDITEDYFIRFRVPYRHEKLYGNINGKEIISPVDLIDDPRNV